jgi:flagellar motor switch protein FliM
MSDILSQEEIDALLTSMDKGEVDLEQEQGGEAQAVSYDLTSKDIMLHDQFHALKEIIDKFIKLSRASMSSVLQRTVDIKTSTIEMIKFGEFISGFSGPASFSVFDMAPLNGSALLAIDANLGFSMIDCMLGGDGKELGKPREYTQIEQRLVKRVNLELLKCLEDAWVLVYEITTLLKKNETRPEFVNLYAPSDFVLIIVFSIENEHFAGNAHFCIPYFMLEPIKDKLSARYITGSALETKKNSQMRELISAIKVNVTAELGKAYKITGHDLLSLKSGDILKLNTSVQDPLIVTVERVPKYLGLPGILKGNRAVQIMNMVHADGGVIDGRD